MSSPFHDSKFSHDLCSLDITQAGAIRHTGSWIDDSDCENPLNTRPRCIEIPTDDKDEAQKISNPDRCVQDPSIKLERDTRCRPKVDVISGSSSTFGKQYQHCVGPNHSDATKKELSPPRQPPQPPCNVLKRKRSLQSTSTLEAGRSLSQASTQAQCGTDDEKRSQSFNGPKDSNETS